FGDELRVPAERTNRSRLAVPDGARAVDGKGAQLRDARELSLPPSKLIANRRRVPTAPLPRRIISVLELRQRLCVGALDPASQKRQRPLVHGDVMCSNQYDPARLADPIKRPARRRLG